MELRQHSRQSGVNRGVASRSTKAGGGTPATLPPAGWSRRSLRRSTKAGGGTPATPPIPRSSPRRGLPLNEGRRWNSGNTTMTHAPPSKIAAAQRRPEVELRQHPSASSFRRKTPIPLNEGRRWNSGNTWNWLAVGMARRLAQRRPEVELRQHLARYPTALRLPRRSTKAGGGTPATPAFSRGGQTDQKGRSTKAGGGTPATPKLPAVSQSLFRSAQRRPEVELRQHPCVEVYLLRIVARSTKAGGGTPATRFHYPQKSL